MMKRTKRYWDELRRLSRYEGDCYRAESNDGFAFGLRRVADLFAEEVDECHTELRQRLAEETLAGCVRLVVSCLGDETKTKTNTKTKAEDGDRAMFRDTVDELAARLRSEDFDEAGWSDEARTALHRKMVSVMCVAVWMLYGDGGNALIAKGMVDEDGHYDVDDFFRTYMGASWLTLRPSLYTGFCQRMRFELDDDGCFKPDFLLANPPIEGDLLSKTDWRLLAATEDELRRLLRAVYPVAEFEFMLSVVKLIWTLQAVVAKKEEVNGGEADDNADFLLSQGQNLAEMAESLSGLSGVLPDEVPEWFSQLLGQLSSSVKEAANQSPLLNGKLLEQYTASSQKALEDRLAVQRRELRTAKLRAANAEQRAARLKEISAAKDVDATMRRQIEQLQDEVERLKARREEEAEGLRQEVRQEVFAELERHMHDSLRMLSLAGGAGVGSALMMVMQLFGRIPEMSAMLNSYVSGIQQQAQTPTVMTVNNPQNCSSVEQQCVK